MRDNKSKKLDVRVTESEKELIKKYAEERNLTISELVRLALTQIIGGNTK